MGIEPTKPSCSASPVLKTGRATRRLYASAGEGIRGAGRVVPMTVRMTQYAAGGGCACKVPIGELERLLAGVDLPGGPDLLVGADGDDAAVVRLDAGRAVISTADFFTPVVDDPFDWGRIVAANAMSDVWAMGGECVLAINLVGWPRAVLDLDLLAEVLRGGAEVAREAGCPVAGGHTIDAPEPLYGMAVTGIGDPNRLLRKDAARAGLPLTPHQAARRRGAQLAAQGHRRGLPRRRWRRWSRSTPRPLARRSPPGRRPRPTSPASGCSATCHDAAVLRGRGAARRRGGAAARRGAGCRARRVRQRWHPAQPRVGAAVPRRRGRGAEDDLLLLADAQTSGGLLVVGEVPGGVVIGETVAGPARVTLS